MGRVRYSEDAGNDLIAIASAVAAASPARALKLIDDIHAGCRALAAFPHLGRRRDELDHGLRSLPIERYVVLYYPFADGVDIARILHTARDIEALL
ncbi:conserved hypothetical protein [uncultured Defluviicoccus sp.]|uniref:Uncharacterized protein n=1 Tax=metagenome TaxID=256318 RepID=A0A380TK32_9ZZZZ|nr:conserved hypothetical protein [uncultured Defluviicoccus sp.]